MDPSLIPRLLLGSWWAERKRAWYVLFPHAHNYLCLTCVQAKVAGERIIEASLSEPHTSVTALQDVCVCLVRVAIPETLNSTNGKRTFVHVLKLLALLFSDS